jgi:hypothetical protein
MRTPLLWNWSISQKKWIDFIDVDIYCFNDIINHLRFTLNTDRALNLCWLPKELQNKIQLLKHKVSLKEIFDWLWIESYKIVTGNHTSIKTLKKQWVIYVLDINGYWDLHFNSINWHFNCNEIPNKCVLLYNTEKPINITNRLINWIKNKINKSMNNSLNHH